MPKETVRSEKIALKNVRLSFPHLFEPKAFNPGQKPRYEATFLLDPSKKEHAAAIKLIVDTANECLERAFGETPKGIECGFQFADGETAIDLGGVKWRGKPKEYEGYQGMFCISTNSPNRVTVVDQRRAPLAESDDRIYGGSWVNASITLWIQDNQFGKRVNANLRAVQLVNSGEAFGVRAADPEEEFEIIEDDDELDLLLA
jgi:hypothetical protein